MLHRKLLRFLEELTRVELLFITNKFHAEGRSERHLSSVLIVRDWLFRAVGYWIVHSSMVASGHELLKTLRLDLLALLFFQIFRYGFTQRLASIQHRQQPRHLNYLCTRGRVPHHTTTPATAGEGRGRGLLTQIWGRTRRGRKGSSYGRETGGTTFWVVCSIWICADWRSDNGLYG